MGKIIFWLVWVLELAAFAFLGGCFVLLLGFDGGSMGRDSIIAFAIIAAAGVAVVYGLIQAVRAFRQGDPPGRLALFLALPPLAVFLAFGSCMMIFS